MGEDLYRLVTTGLLGVTVLLLLVAVSQLGRLQKALRPGSATEPSDDRSEPAPAETASEDPVLEAQPAPEAEPEPEPAVVESDAQAPEEEGPFERDGRWWFRRDGDLLVYDEQREEWVDPEHPLDEAKGWDTKGFAAPTEASPAAQTEAPIETGPAPYQPVADTAPQPVAEPVPQTAPEPVPETTPEPEPEPAQPTPEPVAAAPVGSAPTTQGPDPGSGGHWKCPSCGVVNGSTATSCRMCFAARP